MKKKGALLVLSLAAFLCFGCNGSSDLKYFDQLGGGQTATDTDETGDTISNPSDEDTSISGDEASEDGAVAIDLSNITSGSGYEYADNVLSLKTAGTYVLSGNLNGTIEVAKKAINIILAGVTITPLDTQYTGAIVYKKENSNQLSLTVKEGTTNTIYDSTANIESYNADADEGIIVVKSGTNVALNGKGTLNLISRSTASTGIKVKDSTLTIEDTKLNITATKHGIKAGTKLVIKNADITVNSTEDGIKTDVSPSTADEALAYAAQSYAGYIYIETSNINITSGDDGIFANSYMHIKNGTKTIAVTTNGGAPSLSQITERSSDQVDGKAIKVGGITLENEDGTEVDYPSTSETGYTLLIESGNFDINSNGDAITSKGNLLISGGDIDLASGDDGIHAEYLTKVTGGDITIDRAYEGVEGATIEIYGGNLDITASDDGINAANGDLTNYDFNLYIGGGTVYVNAQGDGVDSNGTMEFAGGTTIINGPTGSDNGALDADQGILMNGGNLIAMGSSGMAEVPGSNSSQCVLGWNTSTQSAGTKVSLTVNGVEKLSTTSAKTFASVVISSDGLKTGDSVVFTIGSNSQSATLSQIVTTYGNNYSGPGGSGGGNQPGGPGRR